MIPLMDAAGKTGGFTGRILDDKIKNAPKYLNTPETLLYHKSRHIFGLSQAKKALVQSGFAVLVEGNMDVVSSHQAGVAEAVATAGTAMTPEHLKGLARFTKDIRLAYDRDAAGIRAAERAVELASSLGIRLSVIADYPAKDPDDLIQKGPELWQEAVSKPRPAVEWLFDEYAKRYDLGTGTGKREYAEVTAAVMRTIKDDIERASYEQSVAERLAVDAELVKQKVSSKAAGAPKRLRRGSPEQVEKQSLVEETLLGLLLWMTERETPIDLAVAGIRGMLDRAEKLDYTRKQELILRAEGRYASWSQEDFQDEIKSLLARQVDEAKRAEKQELLSLLAEAEAEGDDVAVMELVKALNEINKG